MGEIYSIENSLPIYIEITKVSLEKAERQAKQLRTAYEKGKKLQEKLPKLQSQLEAVNQRANLTTCQRPILTSLSV